VTGRIRRPRPLLAAALAAASGAWTCHAPFIDPAPMVACAAVEGPLDADARTEALDGEFALRLVATRGARAGHVAYGTLRLAGYAAGAGPSIDPRPDVRYPAHGSAALALDSAGAVAPGDISAASPSRPAVLAIEQSGSAGRQLMLRFGADANGGGPPRFDGSYLALYVDELAPDRFAGRWSSGYAEREAGGHFCAERISAR
jgi:hypothetical protein